MAQLTLHFCDFSSEVAQHPAHFIIVARGKDDGDKGLQLDACIKHWSQMVTSLFCQIDTPARDVAIRRISGVELPKAGQADGERLICPECGTSLKKGGSYTGHMRKEHGVYSRPPRK